MIFKVCFIADIGGKEAKITGNIYDKDLAIQINNISQGRISFVDGKYTSMNSQLAPIANTIIQNYNAVKIKFKWDLPSALKKQILWAKFDIDNNATILAIDAQVQLEKFADDLIEALKANNIRANTNILLTCPRWLTSLDLGFCS